MKKLITVLTVTIAVVLGIIAITPMASQDEQYECHEDDYEYFYYTVTLIDNYYYHGDGIYSQDHLLFTDENILSGEEIKVGDAIVAVFEKGNTTDGLVAVEKVK